MKITVLQQFIKGIIKVDKKHGEVLQEGLARTKWCIWHGNTHKALAKLIDLLWEAEEIEANVYAGLKKFKKMLEEFYDYINHNQRYIPNYGERRRYGAILYG